jgi:hypothetical protein
MFGNAIVPLCVVFPSRKTIVRKCYYTRLRKQNKHVLLVLVECVFMIASFDLWMFKRAHDVFALVMNFLRNYWMPKHITSGLFEVFETSRHTSAISL